METAHLYFAAMVLLMLPLAVVHLLCWQIVKRYPDIMPHKPQREWYMWAEVAMSATCLAMIWYMWMLLGWMVSICATEPLTGALAHIPWIAGTACVLTAKTRHLWKLLGQVQAL